MSTIVIAVDLGHFKAYRVTKNPFGSPAVELIESYDSLEGHGKLAERFSDDAGRFVGGGGKGEVAKGYGEPHHVESEIDKRLVKMIAMDINAIIQKEDCEDWYLAAGEKINKKIIDKLEPAVKSKLNKCISVDLTRIPKSEILNYFT
ncbi:MAG TPA: host attachment protein [Thermodesulfovibrionales bacterium]|nr:host attachment protein [Thermodesulfovibrionales bacterium]